MNMVTGTTPVPQPGDIIRVRTRTWLTENVEPSAAGTIVEAVCLDDDAQGQPLQVLWDIERDTEILDLDRKFLFRAKDSTAHF